MDLNGKNAGAVTPGKISKSTPSKVSKQYENINPNVTSAGFNILKSPAIKSSKKPQKSAPRNPNPISSPSPRNKIRERKFVVARKNSKREKANSSTATCKCKISSNSQKCLCVAYENLRASQEEFFKNRRAEIEVDEENENKTVIQNPNFAIGCEGKLGEDEIESSNQMSSVNAKRKSVPEPRSGTVMHLIKAFEKLSSLPKSEDYDQTDENDSKDWALPGLQPRVSGTQVSSSSFSLSDFSLTLENLGLDSCVSSSLDSTRGSISSRTSCGGRRSSLDGRHSKRRQVRVTSQKPFRLRTEQRGRSKEEEFIKKVQQMMTEEEKQRIPVAQGLPLTTDEPEFLAKPPVKESTRPVDLVLHSDVRAVERSEFDHQVAEKISFIEQYKMERERQQKLAEEEELRRLRRELVPRAQPMPYFDRPFIPRRSVQHPTMSKEPKFHMLPQHKKIKSCV